MAHLIEAGPVAAAPVYALQVVDEDIPETAHDFSVDLIVTQTR